MKVEEPLIRRTLGVKAIRVYVPELMKEIDSSIERDEDPGLIVKKIVRRSLGREGLPEIELVFMGRRHIEELNYYSKDPGNWVIWGALYLSPRQAIRLAKALLEAVLTDKAQRPENEPVELEEFL